jgi:hypothetical protein
MHVVKQLDLLAQFPAAEFKQLQIAAHRIGRLEQRLIVEGLERVVL